MTDNTDNTDFKDYKETNELRDKLTLLANGRLDESEREDLERQLDENPELQQELAFMRALKSGFEHDESSPPGELGLARLKRDIQREKQQQHTPQEEQIKTSGDKNHWKTVSIAACFVIALQMTLLMPDESTEPGITPLSGGVPVDGVSMQIAFKDDAQATQIQAALIEIRGSIISGPSALGIYTVALPKETDVDLTLEKLQAFEFIDEVVISQRSSQ